MNKVELLSAIQENLCQVIDPETGVDVMRMQLVQNIQVDEFGKITYTFRPSSPLCPIAVPLVVSIIQAINQVPGVSGQSITVVDYVEADQLNVMLKSLLDD